MTIDVWRGPGYHPLRRTLDVRAGAATGVLLRLAPVAGFQTTGWWSGDTHVHMNYGGTYRNTPAHLALQARAEGLNLVENLIVNKEQRIPDIAYWRVGLLHAAPDLLFPRCLSVRIGLLNQ